MFLGFAMRNGHRVVVCRAHDQALAVHLTNTAQSPEDVDKIYESCAPWRKLGYLADDGYHVIDANGIVCVIAAAGDRLVSPYQVMEKGELN